MPGENSPYEFSADLSEDQLRCAYFELIRLHERTIEDGEFDRSKKDLQIENLRINISNIKEKNESLESEVARLNSEVVRLLEHSSVLRSQISTMMASRRWRFADNLVKMVRDPMHEFLTLPARLTQKVRNSPRSRSSK